MPTPAPPPPPSSDGGGGGTPSSPPSSSSGGTSASQGQARQNAVMAFRAFLQQLGIPLDPALEQLISRAVGGGWTQTTFMYYLRLSREYAQAFPGIMRRDGTLRMSEAQYIAGYNSARDYASTLGRSLSRAAYGLAIKNGNSPSEIKSKLQAVDVLREHADVFTEFSDYLVATNEIGPKGLSKDEMLQFIMHQGPKRWEQIWQTSYTASQIEAAGIGVGPGQEVRYKELRKLIGMAPPGTDPTKIDFTQLAEDVQTVLPLSALYKAGLTGRDLIQLRLGGPKAVEIATRVQRVIGTYRARFEPADNPQLTASQRGTALRAGGLSPPAQTE